MEILGRLKPHWAWIASAVLVGGALVLVHATGPDAPGVETRPGQFIDAALPTDRPLDTGTLKIPGLDITVSVTEPIDPADLPDFDGRADPVGGSYLGVRFQTTRTDRYDVAVASPGSDTESDLAIDLYADGRRYRLPGSLSGYLAVPGRPQDVRFAFTVDGVRQTLQPSTGKRDAGRASALYVKTTSVDRRRACGTPTLTRGFRYDDYSDKYPPCELFSRGRSAYVDGLGWAAPGHLWQYVRLEVEPRLNAERVVPGKPAQSYRSVSRDSDLTVLIDGRASVGSPRRNAGVDSAYDGDAFAAAQVRQDAPPSTARIVATYRRLVIAGPETDPSVPLAPDVNVTWTEKLS